MPRREEPGYKGKGVLKKKNIKMRLRHRNEIKPADYYCCSQYGYLFHNYTEFQEFIDINDDVSLDLR